MDSQPIPVEHDTFDPLGPDVREMTAPSGRKLHYIDDGPRGGATLLFFGGAGTSVRAFRLMEFTRGLRYEFGIRVVSIERNGLGQTGFDPDAGLVEHAADVWSVLDELGVDRVCPVAVSGGGPYAAHVAAARPQGIASLHIACALSERLDGVERPPFRVEEIAADPVAWWRYPAESPVHRVPGYADSAIEEATRSMFARGRDVAPEGLAQAFDLYESARMADLSGVDAPAFLYWGELDPLVPLAHLERWRAALPGSVTTRVYPGEGHDVQYRHWDQILTDVAYRGERVIVTTAGRTQLVPPAEATALIESGAASAGIAAWA